MKKQNARLLWSSSKGKIDKFLVEEFSEKHNPQYLYRLYSYDMGNCELGWDKMTLGQVLFHLYFRWGFSSFKVEQKAIKELLKIDEFYNELKVHISDITHLTE